MSRAGGGGLPARRAVVRWAWRLFRREWRQQVLVLALLAVAVAAAVAGVAAGYHVAPVEQARPADARTAAAAGVFAVFAVSMLLICLVAAAGFAVVAHRRLRQLGMLAAIGATRRHLRLVLLADGAVVGAAAAVVGTAAGLALWFAFAPTLEAAVAHRIDRLSLPWWQIVLAMLLAVLTSTAAAWRPARTVARVPITLALSARPPRPKPARRSALAAAVLVGIGVVCIGLVGRSNPLLGNALEIHELGLIIAGIVAIGAGLLFVSPLAIRLLAATGARLPVAVRLALRDLARHQARSGSALAAISLALAISTAVVALIKAAGNAAEPQPLRWTLTAAGAVLALGVLAMTIGLIRVEAAADLRTLAATGATSGIRRTLTATTAAALAFLGAVIGVAVAYLALVAGAGSHIGGLARVPVLELAATLAGVPLVAAAAGWMLAGRGPGPLTRARLE